MPQPRLLSIRWSTLFRFLAPALLLLGTHSFLSAQVLIQGAPVHALEGEESCVLTPAHTDGQPRTWRWSLSGDTGGRLEPAAGGRRKFMAPMVVKKKDSL